MTVGLTGQATDKGPLGNLLHIPLPAYTGTCQMGDTPLQPSRAQSTHSP